MIISLLPGMVLWINSAYIKKISNQVLKILSLPILIFIFSAIGLYTYENLSSLMGVYGNVDSAIEQAKIIQADLLREDQYGSNNYDIGEIDGSISSLFRVAPLAIITALYRPLLWEVGSPTMLFSAIEKYIIIIIYSLFVYK